MLSPLVVALLCAPPTSSPATALASDSLVSPAAHPTAASAEWAQPGFRAGFAPRTSDDVKPLYIEHCAKCHGETGDGKGTADLERPARSFLDGGYSYGNTQKAVLRSMRHGIPGTPMPAFGDTLSKEQMTLLADFVISLGPEGTVVEPGASVLQVGDKPSIVHGMTPALKEGGQREPRSLIVGFPNGTTFLYRKQHTELAALFVGDFLDREDWGGRGGSPLKPLGARTWTAGEAAIAAAEIVTDGDQALMRPVKRTAIAGEGVQINFHLRGPKGNLVGSGQEMLHFLEVDGVPIAQRSCVFAKDGASFRPIAGEIVATIEDTSAEPTHPKITVRGVEDGLFALDFEGLKNVRVFIHTNQWTEGLQAALEESLVKEGN